MDCMSLLGYGVCTPAPKLRAGLSFDAGDVDNGCIPLSLRRRTSQATKLAFSAAAMACRWAGFSPAELSGVFASVGGEIQVTDLLCIELAKPDGVISPTAFHNSVNNTAAGYWSIAHGCRQALTTLAAGLDTVAMALLEAWCQLACQGGELLLVCYDERWPDYLASPMGEPPFAWSMVLGAGKRSERIVAIGRPEAGSHLKLPDSLYPLVAKMPVAAAIPLLTLASKGGEEQAIALSPATGGWQVRVEPLSASAKACRSDGCEQSIPVNH